MTSCRLLYNNKDMEVAKFLVDAIKEKNILLCGITPPQAKVNFDGYGATTLNPPDAILIASDLSKASVSTSMTYVTLTS
eukprot:1751186-Prymnesium_polylepis.1